MRGLIKPFRVTNGRRFRLKHFSPDDTSGIESSDDAAKLLARQLDSLWEQQEKLYAQGTWAILLIFQAMDAAGKDSTIKHVMSGINPQGCSVSSFKAPSAEELGHDFLWRTTLRLPERGHIGVFNRSYYEEVLVVRVHPERIEVGRLRGQTADEIDATFALIAFGDDDRVPRGRFLGEARHDCGRGDDRHRV